MKRVNISITERYKALQKTEEGINYKEKCRRGKWCKEGYHFHIDCKQKKIFEAYESGQVNSSQEKLKKSDNKDLDESVFTSFKMHAQTTFLSIELSFYLYQRESPELSKKP